MVRIRARTAVAVRPVWCGIAAARARRHASLLRTNSSIPRTSGLMVGSDAAGWLRQRGCQGCRGAGVVVAWGGGAVRSSGRCLRHVGWLGPVVPPALRRLHCSSTCATSSLTWGDTVGDKWQLSPSRRAEPWHSAKMGDFDVIRQGRWRR